MVFLVNGGGSVKRRRWLAPVLSWAVLASLAAVFANGAWAAGAKDAADPCAAPDVLAAAGESATARALYIKKLEAQPRLACAATGLGAIDARAKQSQTTSSKEEARALCGRASVHRKAHRRSDAIDSYKAALEKEPTADSCGSVGLREMSAGWLSRTSESVANALPSILIGLGLLLLAGLLVLMTGYIKWVGGLFRRIWGIRYILRGRLSLADCDDSALGGEMKVGKALTAAIRERLQRFREEAVDPNGIAYDLDFGTGSEDLADIVSDSGQLSSALAKLGEASEHTKLIAAVVGGVIAALPIKRLAVSGVLGPAVVTAQAANPRFSAAANLFIERGSKLVAALSLNGRVLEAQPAASDYVELCGPAAVWVQYEVARELSDTEVQYPAADSYALVREGLDYHYAGHDDQAEEAFENALQLDRRNWTAHVNLALTKARGALNYTQAVSILRRALTEMKE
jgi:tetratricopeptide (TPR) repeat protein